MPLGRLETLPSRAWSSNSLVAGADYCATMSGLALNQNLTREELLERLRDAGHVQACMHVTSLDPPFDEHLDPSWLKRPNKCCWLRT